MKKLIAFITIGASLLSLYSCTKHTDSPAPPVPEINEPLKIASVVFRHERNAELVTDTFYYHYDGEGRLISYTSNIFYERRWEYTNNHLSAVMTIKGPDTLQEMNSARYSLNGDTIVMDNSGPGWLGAGTDTLFESIVYVNGVLKDRLMYYHDYTLPANVFNYHYTYNQEGNVLSQIVETYEDPRSQSYDVLAWDDKINPMRDEPAVNCYFINDGLPIQSGSLHNPTKFVDKQGITYTADMTYNSQGYPITVKLSNEDYIGVQIFYNN